MVLVKRLYTFMLQKFLPLLAMTFFIVLFILLMQFLFRYIDEMVGKGLPFSVIGELFFYASLTLVPMALPLSILLASLMVFGNLGEKFELTALKAAGISLFRIMRPLIIFIIAVAVGAFFFQNDILPIAQTKMWTLLFSMRQKSPEVEIPTRAFYDQIPGMNLYVEKKNPETGMLYDLIIYDVSQGMENSRVILADSGKLNFTEDKTHLFLHLYRGEMFENIRSSALGSSKSQFMPFRRESFKDKQIYFEFDANFNRMDENTMRNQYIGKNMSQLYHSIDSIQEIVDSIGDRFGQDLQAASYAGVPGMVASRHDTVRVLKPNPPVKMAKALDIDSIFNAPSPAMAKAYLTNAINKARQQRESYLFNSIVLSDQAKVMRRHGIEMHKKFTLSFACLIFFFIGAPLGAIIKKGGLGYPMVISVLMFIFYYIIDNFGYKMARDGKLDVWEGIWLSSAVLLPLGIFFTYKAVGDSAMFNSEAYRNFFNRLIGKHPGRTLTLKEVIMNDVVAAEAISMLEAFVADAIKTHRCAPKRSFIDKLLGRPTLDALTERYECMIDYLSNSRDPVVISLLNRYPVNLNYRNLQSVINTSRLLRTRLLDPQAKIADVTSGTKARRKRLRRYARTIGRSVLRAARRIFAAAKHKGKGSDSEKATAKDLPKDIETDVQTDIPKDIDTDVQKDISKDIDTDIQKDIDTDKPQS